MKKRLLFISMLILSIFAFWAGAAVACNPPEPAIVLDSQVISFELRLGEKSVSHIELMSGCRLELTVVCLGDSIIDLNVINLSGQVEILATGV
ncbi:MAG: hypothetical protein JSV74_05605 [Dehalococcoidia bacterium]|nr:MAG: hypothetical protein JSV74_05605 [Dehalococcoidia bacterium]